MTKEIIEEQITVIDEQLEKYKNALKEIDNLKK